jgi:hypothetical protein
MMVVLQDLIVIMRHHWTLFSKYLVSFLARVILETQRKALDAIISLMDGSLRHLMSLHIFNRYEAYWNKAIGRAE